MVKIQLGSDGEDSNPAEDGVPRQASEPLGEVKINPPAGKLNFTSIFKK